jgi:transcriptional regulator of acetoin/glycerol metabolism
VANESNGEDFTVAPDTMLLFKRYSWPGNIRQLANLLRTAVAMASDDREIRREPLSDDLLEEVGLAPEVGAGPSVENLPDAGTRLGDEELAMIRKTLDAPGGNVSAAARELGISRNTVYRRLQGTNYSSSASGAFLE